MFEFKYSAPQLTSFVICGVEVKTTNELARQCEQFMKENELPIDKLGAIGGEWTLEITPTSLGSVYQLRHSNGNIFDITPYEVW